MILVAATALTACMTALSGIDTAQADFCFVHLSDTHVTATDKAGSNAQKNSDIYREISNLPEHPAFAVTTGDIVETGTPEEYAVYAKTLANLKIPHYEAPGNHDVRWNPHGKEGYVTGTGQPLYQSWDYENVHFVLLDSTVLLQHWAHFDQSVLDWLRTDLAKVGPDRPVIIGFHHWVGREDVQVDNETQLLDITAPYNVVLWLQGHGHSDIHWNANGAPAIMSKGLYQGSYHLIKIDATTLTVFKRTEAKPTLALLLSVPLKRAPVPHWTATASLEKDTLHIDATNGDLPTGAQLSFRVDAGKYSPLIPLGEEWNAAAPATDLMVGEHRIWVRAALPDGREYIQALPVSMRRAGTPQPTWVASVGGAVQSRLIRQGNSLYVTTMEGDLVCLDTRTGLERWRYHTAGAIFSTPLVADNTVYFGSTDHFIYAVDAKNGRLRWKHETGGAVFGGAALAGGIVCIASVDTKIYGLDARSGAVRWTAPIEGMVQSQAATDGTRFYVGAWDNMFRALDVATGREVWKQKFGKSFYYSPAIGSPTVGEGLVYVSSNDGYLHAMEAATGKIVWEVAGPSLGYSGPLLHDGKIYNASLTGTGQVFSFDAKTGDKIWESPTGSVIYDSSCAWGQTSDGGAVYVGCVNGVFSAIRAEDGHVLWQYRLAPGHVLSSPITDESHVFIASQNGMVVALPLK